MESYNKTELEQQIKTYTTQLQAALTKVEQQSRQIEIIKQLVQLLHQDVELDHLFETTVDLLSRELAAQCGFLISMNSVTNNFYLNQTHPQSKDLLATYSSIYNRYQEELSKGEVIILSSLKNYKTDVLAIPILGKTNLLGVVILHSFEQQAWSDKEIEFVKIIANHCAIAIFQKQEAALRKGDEKFIKVFHGNPIASSINTYPGAKFIDVNRAWLKVFGYSREEIIGRTTLEVGIWNSLEKRAIAVQQLQEMGVLENWEIRFRNKSGEVRDGLVNMEVIELNGERSILAMLLDITERKCTEVALQQSEQKYRNLVETCQGIIWTVDIPGRFTFVNQAVRQVCGYEPQEMIGHHFSEFMTSNQAEIEQETFVRVLNGESLFQYESQLLHKDGRSVYVSSNIIVLRDDAGKVLGATGTTLDITAFKETEAALIASQAKLSTILDSAITVIINFRVFANQDWEYDYFSSGAETMYGYTPEELISDKNLWLSRVIPEDVETILNTAFQDIFSERTTQIEYRFRHKNETIRWHSFTMFSKRNEATDCWVVTTVDTDISVLKVTEEKLKASLQEKEALLKEVHHRVKNNLQVISSLLDFQAQHIQEPLALAAFQTSQDRVKSIALIHEKLYQSESLAKVNLADYIHSLTTHLVLTYSLNPDNIILQFKLDEVFCSLDIAIPCGLLINELVSNALKHGLPGNSKGKIWVELQFLCLDSEFNRPQFGIIVGNDGIKLSELPNVGSVESVGFQLIYALIQQLHGKLELQTVRGTEFKISFINLNG